ncbi:hypothetical protein B5F34_02015 [Mediterranea sp. An20]|nr:hypothetical protein B5F34_02015 [Mediterranea sp. An20]
MQPAALRPGAWSTGQDKRLLLVEPDFKKPYLDACSSMAFLMGEGERGKLPIPHVRTSGRLVVDISSGKHTSCI